LNTTEINPDQGKMETTMRRNARYSILILATLAILALLTGCSDGGDDGFLGAGKQTADGDWDGNFAHPNVANVGSLDLSLTENDGRIGGFYSIAFQVRGSTRYGRGGGDVSGQRGGEIVLRLENVMLDNCDWIATLTQQGDTMTGTYSSTCDSRSRGDLAFEYAP